jgi:hypothetical protein
MKNYFMAVSVVAALLAPAQTRAATVNIDFIFTNTATGTTVTGEIDDLTVGGTSAASAVFITGYTETSPPNPYSFPTPLFLVPIDIAHNVFTVDAFGALTAATYSGKGFFGTGIFNYVTLTLNKITDAPANGSVFQYVENDFHNGTVQSGGDFGNTSFVSVSATPLPAALPLFAGGLGVIGLLARRRKQKNAAALAAA